MSAWLCSENHINLIASFAANPEAAFKILVDENLRSLSARYPGRDFLDEWKQEAAQFKFCPSSLAFRDIANTQEATLIVKQCDCYDYQACETDDYSMTEAARLVEAVRKLAIQAGGDSDGALWEMQPWGID